MAQLKPCPFCGCQMDYKLGEFDAMWLDHKGSSECLGAVIGQYCRPKNIDVYTKMWNSRADIRCKTCAHMRYGFNGADVECEEGGCRNWSLWKKR